MKLEQNCVKVAAASPASCAFPCCGSHLSMDAGAPLTDNASPLQKGAPIVRVCSTTSFNGTFRVMPTADATSCPAPIDLWSHVKVRDEWLIDLSAVVVEVNDGQPYCIVPSYNSYLLSTSNSILAYWASHGDTSGSLAEVARDVLRRLMHTGLILSRIQKIVMRSYIPDALWRFSPRAAPNSDIFTKIVKEIAHRLTHGISLTLQTVSCVVETKDPAKPLSCDYEAWIKSLASWLVYYLECPTHDKLFGTDRMADKKEIEEARNKIQTLCADNCGSQTQPRNEPKKFDSKEVADIFGITPLAASCLWSVANLVCNGPLLAVTQDAREGVLMKYSLGKLLLFSKGTLFHVTREFGKEISRMDVIRDKYAAPSSFVSVTRPIQKTFRGCYPEFRRTAVFKLPADDRNEMIEKIECDYLIDCCRVTENLEMHSIIDQSEIFQSFRSLATLSAFQIDIAHISKTGNGQWRTMLLNRPLGGDESDLTKVYRSMLRKTRITPDGLISEVSKLTAFIVWAAVIASLWLGLYASGAKNLSWTDRIDSLVKVSGPVFLLLVVAEYLSPHERYIKVLLTSKIEIKKMSSLARFLGLSYNETLWLVATDPRVNRLLHSHGTGFLRESATGPLVLDGISRPRETIGHNSVWGEKFIVDDIGVRALNGQGREILHVEKCVELTGPGLVVISHEGSKEIRGSTPTD